MEHILISNTILWPAVLWYRAVLLYIAIMTNLPIGSIRGLKRSKQASAVFAKRNEGATYRQSADQFGISQQTLWKIIRSPEYERLVEELELVAIRFHDVHELFQSKMRDSEYVDVHTN